MESALSASLMAAVKQMVHLSMSEMQLLRPPEAPFIESRESMGCGTSKEVPSDKTVYGFDMFLSCKWAILELDVRVICKGRKSCSWTKSAQQLTLPSFSMTLPATPYKKLEYL